MAPSEAVIRKIRAGFPASQAAGCAVVSFKLDIAINEWYSERNRTGLNPTCLKT